MGSFATGVTVITVEAGGSTHAMTANAFMSGSLEPPLCVVSIAKRAHTHEMIRRSGHFGVNILSADQQDLALFFAGKVSPAVQARFQRVGEVSLLQDCAARIAAKVNSQCDCGDHTLFVGAILFMDSNDRPPLVYHRSAFAALEAKMREGIPVPEFW
ncbi:MAG TPA: flavin reductase family protein [Roseiarcus sp.]|nr:flavin reductase family protein [Roseiarcus sp.]